MTETKHYCDICSEQIHVDRTLLRVRSGPMRPRRLDIDICADCLPRLAALLDDRPAGCTAPTPRPSKANRAANGATPP